MTTPVGPRVPVATYRLQLGSHLTFEDAAGRVPYLAARLLVPPEAGPRQEGPAHQLVTSLPEMPAVGIADECEAAVRTSAAHQALILRDGAMPRVSPGGIQGGALLGPRVADFSELPPHRSELGDELLFGLVFVPHADLGLTLTPDTRSNRRLAHHG